MKKRLEITWTNKDKILYYDEKAKDYEWLEPTDIRVSEPRLLIEKKICGIQNAYWNPAEKVWRKIEKAIPPEEQNLLIKGDNLLALKALEEDFTNTIKLIYIDPPFNTGQAFEQYDDGYEHSIWLSLMKSRLEILYNLLRYDGVIWIHLDDNEVHYGKVMADEIFLRRNFLANIIWQKKFSPQSDAKFFSDMHDHILVYAKDASQCKINLLQRTDLQNQRYKNPDNDPRGDWTSGDLSVKTYNEKYDYPIKTPSGKMVRPPKGTCWRVSKERFAELVKDKRIWFGKNGSNVPRIKRFLSEVKEGIVPGSIWTHDEVGHNQEARQLLKKVLPKAEVFATPKPERLLQRIIQLSTSEGDWVLDSFAGSGTTGAVAHKMGRKWIMIEMGEHAETHMIPRLHAIINGKDLDKKKYGGGFRYCILGPSLFNKDNGIISVNYSNGPLIRAICKIEGFKPTSNGVLHGVVNVKRYCHVTEAFVTQDYVDELVEHISEDKSLVVYCMKKLSKLKLPDNVTIKKIPRDVAVKFKLN